MNCVAHPKEFINSLVLRQSPGLGTLASIVPTATFDLSSKWQQISIINILNEHMANFLKCKGTCAMRLFMAMVPEKNRTHGIYASSDSVPSILFTLGVL